MHSWLGSIVVLSGVVLSGAVAACGDESEAQRRGVGAGCLTNDDCTETGQTCLAFKGGYCGVAGCVTDANCPDGSGCVAHTDGSNYCFLICDAKADCNVSRAADSEANCSSTATWADANNGKACVPPSGN